MRKIVEQFPGGGFPRVVGAGASDTFHQFSEFGLGPVISISTPPSPVLDDDTLETTIVDVNKASLMNAGWRQVFHGVSESETLDGHINSGWWRILDVDTVRMERDLGSEFFDLTVFESVIEWNSIPVRIQKGSTTIGSGATTASTTLTDAVASDKGMVIWRGTQVQATTSFVAEWYANVFLDDLSLGKYNDITAQRFTSGVEIIVYWTIVEFLVGANVTIQQIEIDVPSGSTSVTDTVSSVDTAKTFIMKQGMGEIHGSTFNNMQAISTYITLTSSTILTTVRAASGVQITQYANVVEFA